MLYFHKTDDELGQKIKDYLVEMSAAHRELDSETGESYIRENEIVIKGEPSIFRYLDSLYRSLEDERILSADACMVKPNGGGNVC